ncbi:MAG: hypothetical protein ABSE73_18675 [Planctomycetota bacterium]
MPGSFIFNFESLAEFRPRCPTALLTVAGLLVALETGLRLIPEEKLIPARSHQGEMYFVERNVLPRIPRPQVLVLGTSRIRRAVVPRQLDELLGLPPNSTLNAGLDGGHAFEALHFYERNRAQLKQARLVILNTDDWYLTCGWQLTSIFGVYAPWRDRLELFEPQRSRLLLDGVFAMRLRLRLLHLSFSNWVTGLKDVPLGLMLDENNQVLPPPSGPDVPVNVDPTIYEAGIEDTYNRFAICPVMVRHIEELARLVREDGGRFVLMQLSNRSAYQVAVQKLHAADYALHVATLGALAQRLDVPLAIFTQPSECGLTDACYADYGHVNRAGARKFTVFLADLIKKEGWLK